MNNNNLIIVIPIGMCKQLFRQGKEFSNLNWTITNIKKKKNKKNNNNNNNQIGPAVLKSDAYQQTGIHFY